MSDRNQSSNFNFNFIKVKDLDGTKRGKSIFRVCPSIFRYSKWYIWIIDNFKMINSSSSSRTDRLVHFQQNAGLRLFVHTLIVHGIDDCYQITRTFGGFSAQCLSKLFLKEFTVLLLTTSLSRALERALERQYIGKIFMLIGLILFLNYISECCTGPGRMKKLA